MAKIKTKEEALNEATEILKNLRSPFPSGTGPIFRNHDKRAEDVNLFSEKSKGIDFVYLFDKINVFPKPKN